MALLVPEGMAHAELAGVGPGAAFYAAPIGLLPHAVFGTSTKRDQTTTAIGECISLADIEIGSVENF